MPPWDRDTPWRQGFFLSDEDIYRLGLGSSDSPEKTVAIVATHDCDLPQAPEVEPTFEIVCGKFIEALDGSLTHTKSPRRLHLEVDVRAASKRPIELLATSKRFLDKEILPTLSINPDLKISSRSGR